MHLYIRINRCAPCVIVLYLIIILGCSVERDTKDAILVSQSTGSYSQIGGKKYTFEISNETLKDSPTWSINNTIPLTTVDAIKIAELEIANYSKEKDLFYLSSIELRRFGFTDKWFYVVEFFKRASVNSEMSTNDYLRIPVLLNGQPIKGS